MENQKNIIVSPWNPQKRGFLVQNLVTKVAKWARNKAEVAEIAAEFLRDFATAVEEINTNIENTKTDEKGS